MPILSQPHLPLIKTKNLQKNIFETFFSLFEIIARKIPYGVDILNSLSVKNFQPKLATNCPPPKNQLS